MQTKLILVEGIPGSGKSTIAQRIAAYLQTENINAVLYSEGDAHPADLAWCSYIPIDEYKDIIAKYPQFAQNIKDHTLVENDFAVVAYTKLGLVLEDVQLRQYFESYEIYDGKVTPEQFTAIHLKRWQRFAERALTEDKVYIFECAFLQNHICELAIREKDNDFISEYLITLIATVVKLNPIIFYLSQLDINETIRRVAKERVSSDKNKYSDWIDLVIDWVEKSAYGKNQGLQGFEGVIQFMEIRKKLEMNILRKLPINKQIIDNPDYNWEEVFEKVKEALRTSEVVKI